MGGLWARAPNRSPSVARRAAALARRRCRAAVEEYYFRRELFTANVLVRHMRWHEVSIWPTDFEPGMPTTLVLSRADAIVPVAALARDVVGTGGATLARSSARGVRLLLLPGGHGEWVMHPPSARRVAERVREHARPSGASGPAPHGRMNDELMK